MGKNSSPLFELINRRDRNSKRSMKLPPWMKDEKPAAIEPAVRGGAEAGDPSASQVGGEPGPSRFKVNMRDGVDGLRRWLRGPTPLRMPRGAVLILCGVVGVVVLAAFMMGRNLGASSTAQSRQEYAAAVASLSGYQEKPINPTIIPATVTGVNDVTAGAADAASVYNPGTSTDAQADPRQPGLNYYRLTVVPEASRADAQRMAAFLAQQGLDTALIPINNGRSLKLVVLRGFTKPLSDPEAKLFEERIKALGRQWKAQHRGTTDFRDMIPEKYRPGVN